MWREIGNTGLSFLILMFMAQVRKFQDGGKTFTLGGYTFNTNNAEDMKMLEEMASNSTYGGIAQSVLDNVRNGSYANTLKMYRTADGRVVMEGGLQDVADQHLSSGTQKALQRKDTYINNLFKRQSAVDWANNTDAFLSEIARRKTVKPVESSPKYEYKITGVSDIHNGQIGYDDNTNKWISNVNNIGQINQLQLLEDYYHSNEEGRKKYDVSALDPDALSRWLEWRKTQGNDKINWAEKFNTNATRLPDNDSFYQNYNWFGFTPGTKSQIDAREAAANLATVKDTLKGKGLDWEGIENNFYIGSDGGVYANSDFITMLGLTGSTGYKFNDDWRKQYADMGITNPFASLYGHTLWNGRLYKDDDINLHELLKQSQFDELQNQYKFVDAEKILKTLWTEESKNQYQNYINQEGIYHPALFGKNIHLAQLKSKNPNNVLIEYLVRKPNDPFFGYEKAYGLLGTSGGIRELTLDQAKERAILKNDKFAYQTAPTFGSPLNSNNIYEVLDYSNNSSGARLFHNPYNNEYYIYSPNADSGKHVYKIPKSVSNQFKDRFWIVLRQNPELLENLAHAISLLGTQDRKESESDDAIRNTHRLASNDQLWRSIMDTIAQINLDDLKQNKNVNIYAQQWDPFIQSFEITDTPVQSNKKGGVLKFSNGGIGRESFRFKKYTPTKLKKDDKKKDDDKPMTNADWWEVGSLAADTIAAITTIIDPTNIGGAALSLGATGAGFISDIKKDGLDWGDAGRLGLNLLMDFGTLVPILGDSIAASRLAKVATKITPWIARLARLGYIEGITEGTIVLFSKIADGNFKDLTKDDWRAALNLLNGLTSLKRTGMSNMPTKKVTQDFSDIKGRKDNTSVKLESAAIDNIKKTDVDVRLLKAQEEVLAAHNKKYPDKQITLEEVPKYYNIPTEKTARHWYTPWSRRVVPDLNKQSTETVPLTWQEVNQLNKNENKGNFGKWLSGTGDTQQMYQRQMYGEKTSGKTWNSGQWYKPLFVQGYNVNPDYLYNWWNEYHVEPEPEPIQYLSPEEFFGYYKKGGILKGQNGLNSSQTFKPKVGDWKPLLKPSMLDPNYSITTYPTQRAWNNAITGTFSNTPTIIDAFGNELRLNVNKDFVKQDPATTGTTAATTGTATNTTFKEKTPEELAKMSMAERMSYDHQKQLHQQNQKKTQTVSSQDGSTTSMHPVASSSGRTLKQGETIVDVMSADAKAATSHTPAPAEVTGQLSGRVDSDTNEYLRKAEQSRNRNRLAQLFAADLQRRMSNQFADKTRNNLLMNRVVSPNLSWNQRWIDPRGNQAERLGASLLTSTNQFNTADSGLNRAAKLDMLEKIGQIGMNNIDQQANAFNAQLDATNQRNMQQRIMDAQTRTQNNQIMSNAYMASDQQRYGANNVWLTTTSNIFDKIEAEDTTKWNKLGQTKANLEMQAARYDELAASATDEKTKSAYQAMAANLRDPKTLELYLNSGGYSTQSAKKGAKLRPMHEQMLIDKQKLVARAIEKINDNTMKILLKAMS